MRVTSIELTNFRSFVASGNVELGPLNVLVGPNNSGKSSIIRGLYMLQQGGSELYPEVRAGASTATVEIALAGLNGVKAWGAHANSGSAKFSATLTTEDRRTGTKVFKVTSTGQPETSGEIQFPAEDPRHFVVPYLSKRKPQFYDEDVKEATAYAVRPQMGNLGAKLQRVSNPAFPEYKAYAEACQRILGVVVTAVHSQNGMRPGIYLPSRQTIPIEQMGEGVPNIVEMLASLAISEGKLFLLEEPENDLHPAALKALLELIAISSERNQFVISTHSNIVVRHLCSLPQSKLFRVKAEPNVLPTIATIEDVGNSAESRIAVLRELGYELSDFELWDGWLILEESSAERIIRDFLIPWFVPRLSSLRTISAGGASKVAPAFEEFRRLFLYAHLEPVYRHRAWVRVDGDEVGQDVVAKLRGKYAEILPERFGWYTSGQFERYYPKRFEDEATAALALSDRQGKQEAKKALFERVRLWLLADREEAERALAESAAEIIEDLRRIERELNGSAARD